MELDTNKIDDAVLALLCLGLHEGARAWKGFDWGALDRLHEKGYISDPRSKAKSVAFTRQGLEQARRRLEDIFGKRADARTLDQLLRGVTDQNLPDERDTGPSAGKEDW
jgi:hypothetical protein